jgi:hypothetical protein
MNPLLMMGRQFWGRKQVNEHTILESAYKCMWEQFVVILPLDNYPIWRAF